MKRKSGGAPSDQQSAVWLIASVLLQYPDERVYSRLDDAADALAAVPGTARTSLQRLVDWLRTEPATEAAEHHVATFDLTRRCSPYLTYYRYGDTRQRGMALLALKQSYRQAGLEPPTVELPDYLPAMLEFAALAGDSAGHRLLEGHRAGLELLRLSLADAGSPYAAALDAVCAGLSRISDRVAADVRRLAEDGPPKEEVGLDPVGSQPFAPPEFMTGSGLGTVP
jgi:nitrate reductase delta subunit